jgi:mRNA deadenylase 3'-5' endonuclease subunit Ccr4
LATRNHFPYVVDSSLNWDNRKMTLLRQLQVLDADVVCLEELSDYWT